jgi:outer membrane protein TolC
MIAAIQSRAGARIADLSLVVLLLLVLPVRGIAQTPVPTVTLTQALELARGVAPTVVTARGNVRSADAQVLSAKGEYLPSVTATSSGVNAFAGGPARVNPVTGVVQSGNSSTTTVGLGISASIDLFTGFRRGADRRSARATQSAAVASLTDAQFQTDLAVTQQYFAALAAQQLVGVRQASVRVAEEQLAQSVAKLHVGSATRADSLSSLVNLGTAQLNLVSAQSGVAGAQASLGRLLGLDAPVAAADDSAFYDFSVELDTLELLREALDRSPSVQAADASAQAANASISSAKAAYWPTLSLTGAGSWLGSDNLSYQLYPQRSITLGLNWPLFNRFQREQSIAVREVAYDAADATAKDTRRGVRASLITQEAALEAARVQIRITRTSVDAATENLRVVNERYKVGAATIVDVLTAQTSLAQAGVDAINARFAYLNAKAQIEALIGRRL